MSQAEFLEKKCIDSVCICVCVFVCVCVCVCVCCVMISLCHKQNFAMYFQQVYLLLEDQTIYFSCWIFEQKSIEINMNCTVLWVEQPVKRFTGTLQSSALLESNQAVFQLLSYYTNCDSLPYIK